MTHKRIIHWFRYDLRLRDNPSLSQAAKEGHILPLYILDTVHTETKPFGEASRCWLHHSLSHLKKELDNKLVIQSGDPITLLSQLVKDHHIDEVYWNRCYIPWEIQRDKQIKTKLEAQGVVVKTYNGSLLWEPWEVKKKSGGYYQVFTPFYKKGCLQTIMPREPLDKPHKINYITQSHLSSDIQGLNLMPHLPWGKKIMDHWQVGEAAAKKQLKQFIEKYLHDYKTGRNFPAQETISCLSPYLHWGEISPNQIWYAIKQVNQNPNTATFLSELAWREFYCHLLYHHPHSYKDNLQEKFNNFPWRYSEKKLKAWQQGMTGYPMVDAGMRQLWQTGFMHNRVRMITASFLVKNLLIHWHQGEAWFWDCLVDADVASNCGNWQWVAGCGSDAAPFFRIFNPVTQGEKFDPSGDYIRQYVPELAKLPQKYLYAPWEAPESVLSEAGIELGKTYPKPIVDLPNSRNQALEAFENLKN